MDSVESKRHFGNFYLSVFLGSLLFILLGVLVIKIPNASFPQGNEILMYVIGGAAILLGLYAPIKYLQNVPNIKVDRTHLSINQKKYKWNEIDSIELTGKLKFKLVMPFLMEGTAVKFKNGDSRYIYDKMYSNSWIIKSFIQQVIIDKKNYVAEPLKAIKGISTDLGDFAYYKGSPIFSFRGLILWGMIITLIIIPLRQKDVNTKGLIPLVFFCLFWFLINASFMDYIGISNNWLIIRNHYFFWKKRQYELTAIREVIFESNSNQPNSLRVITVEYKNEAFKAGSLSKSNWQQLKNALETKNIKVRNEIFI